MNPTASPSPADDLRPIVPPVRFVDSLDATWLVIGLSVLTLLAGIGLWLYLRRRGHATAGPALTARQIAAGRLRELQAQVGELDARTFGNEVCDVLRAFVAAEYRLQPLRQTSPEFLSAAAHSRAFSAGEHALLCDFLQECDLLKFARANATLPAKERLLGQAAAFIENAAAAPPPLPPKLPPPLPQRPPPLPAGAR